MAANRLDMILQGTLFLLRVVGIDITLIGDQRYLRVDNGILSLRIVQDDIGLHLLTSIVVLQGATLFVPQTSLHLVMDTLSQSL